MKINTSFEFKTPKEQIEGEILNLKRLWARSLVGTKEWNRKNEKYGEKPKKLPQAYGILVTLQIYNQIREIYLCNNPFPHDTDDLFGLKVGILKKGEGEIYMVDKENFEKGRRNELE